MTDSRLNISLDVFDDDVLESTETFFMVLTVPDNPADNLFVGDVSQVTVTIADNEGVVLILQ